MFHLGPQPGLKEQEAAAILAATNTGPTPCTITGYAVVTLRQSGGRAMPFRYSDGGGIFVTSAPAKPVTVQRGGSVYLLVANTRCTDGPSAVATSADLQVSGWARPEHVALDEPGRQTSISTCRDYPFPVTNTVWVSPFEQDRLTLVP